MGKIYKSMLEEASDDELEAIVRTIQKIFEDRKAKKAQEVVDRKERFGIEKK